MTVTIYGIKTCDTVKKARTWLEGRGVAHRFVDYRAEGLDPKNLARWKTRGRLGEAAQQGEHDLQGTA